MLEKDDENISGILGEEPEENQFFFDENPIKLNLNHKSAIIIPNISQKKNSCDDYHMMTDINCEDYQGLSELGKMHNSNINRQQNIGEKENCFTSVKLVCKNMKNSISKDEDMNHVIQDFYTYYLESLNEDTYKSKSFVYFRIFLVSLGQLYGG